MRPSAITARYATRVRLMLGGRHLLRKLKVVPYVTCPHCRVTSYAPRSYQERRTRCPSCQEALGELASRHVVAVPPDHASQRVIGGAEDSARSAADQPVAG